MRGDRALTAVIAILTLVWVGIAIGQLVVTSALELTIAVTAVVVLVFALVAITDAVRTRRRAATSYW